MKTTHVNPVIAFTFGLFFTTISCKKSEIVAAGASPKKLADTHTVLTAADKLEIQVAAKKLLNASLVGHGGGLLAVYVLEYQRLRNSHVVPPACGNAHITLHSGIEKIGDTAIARYSYKLNATRICTAYDTSYQYNTALESVSYSSPGVHSFDTVKIGFGNKAYSLGDIDRLTDIGYQRKGYDTLTTGSKLSFVDSIYFGIGGLSWTFNRLTGEISGASGNGAIDGYTSSGTHFHYETFFTFMSGRNIRMQFNQDPLYYLKY